VLPYFRKSEGLAPTSEVMIDDIAHNSDGPLGVSVRSPVLRAAQDFVAAAEATGVPRGDYNGRDRGGASGVASLFQTTTRLGACLRNSGFWWRVKGESDSACS
jgi:choline dehydrogenase